MKLEGHFPADSMAHTFFPRVRLSAKIRLLEYRYCELLMESTPSPPPGNTVQVLEQAGRAIRYPTLASVRFGELWAVYSSFIQGITSSPNGRDSV